MAHILVVDDHLPTRELLRALLQYKGYHVVLAENGPAALAAAMQEPPHLVLVDLVMPDIDGFTLMRALRERTPCKDAPIVLMSASLEEEKARKLGEQRGAFAYVSKPFDSRLIYSVVESALAAGDPQGMPQ